ncbi:unnamed protein product [Protopolystoma xenopodis]|uniref:Uncharacterized protein n=1 Tax=Protopolystoma xenopodis TaxID=117903 RepID=A0A448WH18_9PLAT|nr:unnamed protein product [Protopolystoma xenopodis]
MSLQLSTAPSLHLPTSMLLPPLTIPIPMAQLLHLMSWSPNKLQALTKQKLERESLNSMGSSQDGVESNEHISLQVWQQN